jgi:hypothetical protein
VRLCCDQDLREPFDQTIRPDDLGRSAGAARRDSENDSDPPPHRGHSRVEEKGTFFFEKKNQKTFIRFGQLACLRDQPDRKSKFLKICTFYLKKEKFFLLPTSKRLNPNGFVRRKKTCG